jgi:hypothetical protein
MAAGNAHFLPVPAAKARNAGDDTDKRPGLFFSAVVQANHTG